jgi:hypothetical protein
VNLRPAARMVICSRSAGNFFPFLQTPGAHGRPGTALSTPKWYSLTAILILTRDATELLHRRARVLLHAAAAMTLAMRTVAVGDEFSVAVVGDEVAGSGGRRSRKRQLVGPATGAGCVPSPGAWTRDGDGSREEGGRGQADEEQQLESGGGSGSAYETGAGVLCMVPSCGIPWPSPSLEKMGVRVPFCKKSARRGAASA